MIKLDSIAPNFTANSNQGIINFHNFINNSWCLLSTIDNNFNSAFQKEILYLHENMENFNQKNIKIALLNNTVITDFDNFIHNLGIEFPTKNLVYIEDLTLRIFKLYNILSRNDGERNNDSISYLISTEKKIVYTIKQPNFIERNLVESIKIQSCITNMSPA